MYCLIFVTSAYIPNLGPLGPSLPFEKFLVVVGGGWVVVVVETNFSVQLSPKLNNSAQYAWLRIFWKKNYNLDSLSLNSSWQDKILQAQQNSKEYSLWMIELFNFITNLTYVCQISKSKSKLHLRKCLSWLRLSKKSLFQCVKTN